MRGNAPEVFIGRQHCELVMDAELCEQRVDGTDLHTGPTTAVAQLRGSDVIFPVRAEERQSPEPVNDVLTRAGSGKTLQQFLQDQPRGHDRFAAFESAAQRIDLWDGGDLIATKRERPDARIDEERHRRDRSAL